MVLSIAVKHINVFLQISYFLYSWSFLLFSLTLHLSNMFSFAPYQELIVTVQDVWRFENDKWGRKSKMLMCMYKCAQV